MLVTCTECSTSFTMEDKEIKKSGSKVRCSRCKNIFMVYPPSGGEEKDEIHGTDSTQEILDDFTEESDEFEPGSGEEKDLLEGEEIDFDELDRMLEAGDDLELEESHDAAEEESASSGVGDIDFSELEKALDMDESLNVVETGGTGGKKDKPEEEEFDLDALDNALGMDEAPELEEVPKLAEEKPIFKETGDGDLGLFEIEEALKSDEAPGAGKADETGEEIFDFAELEEDLEIDEKPEPEEVSEIMEEEPALPEEGDIGLFGLEKELDTDESAKAGKTPDTEELVFDELDKMFGTDDEPAGKGVPESGEEETAFSESGDLDFSKLEKELEMDEAFLGTGAVAEDGKGALPGEEDLDFSDLDKILDTGKIPVAEADEVREKKESGFFDTEDLDFSDLEKMLETGEIKLDEMELEKKGIKDKPGEGESFDLSDLETAIDKSGYDAIEETEEEPEELVFDFEHEKDDILSKIEDVEEIDFSDLEDVAVSGGTAKPSEKQEVEAEDLDFNFDLEEDAAGRKDEAEEAADLDLSALDKFVSSADEPEQDISLEKVAEEFEFDLDLEPAAVETPAGKELGDVFQDTQELDFSDLENILVGEKPGGGKEKDKEQELELDFDLLPAGVEAEEDVDEVTELDISDIDKMLEMEGMPGDQEKETDGEALELQLGEDESSGGQKAGRFAGTLVSDAMRLKISSEEPEQDDVDKHLKGFEIDKFQQTRVMGEKKARVAVAAEEKTDKKEIKKAKKPLKVKKPSGRFAIILGIIVILLLGAGAFVVYNPFDIEIPFVSDFLGSKADVKGNLKITPVANSIKGDYVETKFGPLFIIKGNVKNDYKNSRSYIKVVGKLYAKEKKLSMTETVFCGNIVSEQDMANLEPAVLKKRLLNRSGDKKSNEKVKPGSTIPFMIIYENPSLDLDEFIIEAESSMKE